LLKGKYCVKGLVLLLLGLFCSALLADSRRVIQYEYDAAGNLVRVETEVSNNPPVVNTLNPSTIRQETLTTVIADGTDLVGAQVSTSAPGLTISNVSTTATTVTFDIIASATSTTGPKTLSFTTSLGADTADITVQPPAPRVVVAPTPIVVASGGATAPVTLQIFPTDIFDHDFTLSVDNALVATVSPGSVTIPAGQNEPANTIQVTGLTDGVTRVNLNSPTLGNFSATVFVTSTVGLPAGPAEFFSQPLGIILETPDIGDLIDLGPFVSSVIGIQKGDGDPPLPPFTVTPIVNPILGVIKGSAITGVTPRALVADDSTNTITVNGQGLSSVDTVQINPPDGITFGALTVAPDGSNVSFPMTVASGSAFGAREIQLFAGTQRVEATPASADQIIIANQLPVITSVSPILINRTETLELRIIGTDLQFATGIEITPADDISLASSINVNAEGTELTFTISVAEFAVLGDRVVTVLSEAGPSSSTPTSSNTITITANPLNLITPIVSPILGITKGDPGTGGDVTLGPFVSTNLGVAKGAFVSSVSPQVGAIGSTVQLTITGQNLADVTSVDLVETDGVTISAPTIAPDGLSLTVDFTIDATAPTTLRNVVVNTATGALAALPPDVTQFRVTPLQPVAEGLSPNFVIKDATAVTINLIGINLDNATNIRVIPPENVSVGAPAVNNEGTFLTFTISADSSAVIGQRVIVVETPAGESDATGTVGNTIIVADEIVSVITPLLSPVLGIEKQTVVNPPMNDLLITTSALGIEKEFTTVTETNIDDLNANQVGIAKGSTAFDISPSVVAINSTATLLINGQDLDAVTDVSFIPADDITITAPFTVSGDNAQIQVPISIGAAAAETLREVVLTTGTGQLRFSRPGDGVLLVAGPQPIIQSMNPIIGTIGSSPTLTISGINFAPGSTTVNIVPNTGVIFNTPIVNGAGTQITIPMIIDITAPVGPRAITITTPAGTTTSNLNPENTFTIAQ